MKTAQPLRWKREHTTLRQGGFTLVEMLVVMGIIVILLGLVVPVVSSLKGSGDFTMNVGNVAETLEQARAYAMANNTYVYVGIGEFNEAESSTTNPRTYGTGKGGQLALVALAARDGTRGYDVSSPQSSWTTYYNSGAPLLAIDRLHLYDNIHLTDFANGNSTNGDLAPTTGNMARPVIDAANGLGNDACVPVTTIAWPLGKAINAGQYNFTKVIQFDPQGVVRLQTNTDSDSIASAVELYLQPAHGNVTPTPPASATAENTGNQAAILIDCMTGSVHIYRP